MPLKYQKNVKQKSVYDIRNIKKKKKKSNKSNQISAFYNGT